MAEDAELQRRLQELDLELENGDAERLREAEDCDLV